MSITQLNTVRRTLIALAGPLFTATMITAVRPLQAADVARRTRVVTRLSCDPRPLSRDRESAPFM